MRNGKTKSLRPIRFAVIGQGNFAQAAILPAFATAAGCELVALFSEDQTKRRSLQRQYRVASALPYREYDTFLRSGAVDAVYIALPNDLHCEYTVRAAQAGVSVLCEKPMAVSSRDAATMLDACTRGRVFLMIAYRLHFEAAHLDLVERMQRGQIGRPRYITSTFGLQVRPDNIRTKRHHGGGPLLDLGVYCINAARYLFRAEPLEVVAFRETTPRDERFSEVDEHVSALLRFPEERTAQFTCSFGSYDHSSLTVVGEKGRLTLDPAYDYVGKRVLTVEVGERSPARKVFPKRDQVAAELMAFADCVRTGRTPEPSGEEGLADLRIIEAIERSFKEGKVQAVEVVARAVRPEASQRIDRPAHEKPKVIHAEPSSQ